MTRPHHLSSRHTDLLFADGELTPGDAVVHIEHGLAEFGGYERVDVGGEAHDLVALIYRNGGKLMLPTGHLDRIWPYGSSADHLTLDRLNSDDWLAHRDELVTELKKSANVLVRKTRKRRASTTRALRPDPESMARFASEFRYDETDDQRTAIGEILADLGSTEPMDRLLIGDVGFGKTEVALRAAAAAVFSGAQAVIAAPTTVLARQHFDCVRTRFETHGIEVAELSRTTSKPDRKRIRERLASGECRIVVGTHALTSKTLKFDALGVVIIDEEQRFGAKRKDKLRKMADANHLLSMTATPIPRSLAMAEVGLCGVSVLATPPAHREPVETQAGGLDFDAMMKAVHTEIARGGQCYIVCPKVAQLKKLARKLEQHHSDFSMTIAHGKMPDAEMEAAMLSFMDGEVDVLLSTSIVESGLDNPRANTMIVWGAEAFGLAQLHQLRGRIGRSKLPAHMLLMTHKKLDGGGKAARRLASFCRMSELGAGFEIARKDRDIRGFGKLDSDRQSGQVSRLGVGLYRHILAQALGDS